MKPGVAAALDRVFINIFIITYFTIIVIWLWVDTPAPIGLVSHMAQGVVNKAAAIAHLTGLGQSWTLFSPKVREDNIYTLVVITYQSGMLKVSELPRMEKLNVFEKWRQEKFRKLFNDNFPFPKYTMLRPPVSRFLIRANAKPGDPPIRLAYFLVSEPFPLPGYPAPALVRKKSTTIANYFVYGTCPEDL